MRSLQKVVKELEKKNYRYLLDKEYLQKEIQQLKEEFHHVRRAGSSKIRLFVTIIDER
ncbi:MAG: hypothetical protein HXS48_18745 [Theionarchaea archaeon]|nr:hypothetical protein [Theionarchaea archaeon]